MKSKFFDKIYSSVYTPSRVTHTICQNNSYTTPKITFTYIIKLIKFIYAVM